MTIQQIIETKLNSNFSIEHLAVENESHMHNVAPGSESHFKVTLVSEDFSKLMLIKRHRLVIKALKQGVGGKILKSLQRAIELQAEHAEAHTALAMYHAEIIDKVGKLIGGMTYGASQTKSLEHFAIALDLTPQSPIANIEFGNGLYLLYGDSRLDDVTDLYIKASAMQPRDAMEKLDVESALAELE